MGAVVFLIVWIIGAAFSFYVIAKHFREHANYLTVSEVFWNSIGSLCLSWLGALMILLIVYSDKPLIRFKKENHKYEGE